MIPSKTISIIRKKYAALKSKLNERTRRHWAAAEAKSLGFGGITAVHKATGIAISTIRIGMREIKTEKARAKTREQKCIRKKGGGRKKLTERYPKLIRALTSIIDPYTRGDPESPLRWTSKDTRAIAEELFRQGYKISHTKVAMMLHEMNYSLQANRKTREGSHHPDRDAQFEYINNSAKKGLSAGEPVISVDSKKKDLVGNFKNPGREWRPKGQPTEVRIHDFPIPGLGKVTPYGIYEIDHNKGWVAVGIDHDTAEFAVASIRKWWHKKGRHSYPNATRLTITADCGGSNGYRNKLWKYELQKFANRTDLIVKVHHFPPGTSKWNKIEHRLFSFITQNWRGRPLLSHATIVNMIASTTTKTGLKVECVLDTRKYPTGRKISDEEFNRINIQFDEFHGEWNYAIHPRKTPRRI